MKLAAEAGSAQSLAPEARRPAVCSICGSGRLSAGPASPRLRVVRCRSCNHHLATHAAAGDDARPDYHIWYDQGDYLASLRATRRRQARLIVATIARLLPEADRVLDYGAGRGWFLDACRDAGMRHLAGADASPLSVEWMREKGIEVVDLAAAAEGAVWPLSFQPRVLTCLDVIEHFAAEDYAGAVSAVIARSGPALELIVIKVPLAEGLMFRAATALARLGVTGPWEQLYQVGSFPPHHHYFSRRSVRLLFAELGLRLVAVRPDIDLEPDLLAERAGLLRQWPGALRAAPGRVAGLIIHLTRMFDSAIFFLRPS